MRYVLPILALLIACLPRAFGQTASKPAAAAVKPPKPAKPAPAPGTAARSNVPPALKTAYAAVPEAERTAIQSDLIWTGDYNGLVGAEFGDRAITAVKAFQKRNGGKETGVLNPDERAKLAQGAKAQQERTGWRLVEDSATGARLGIPTKMAPQSGAATSGSHWQSVHGEVQVETFRVAAPGTTLASVFEQQRKEPAERKVEYNVLRGDFFVISGLQGLKKFYVRAAARENSNGQPGSDVRGITILYDQSMEGTMDRIAVAMSSAFAAFPAPLAGAPPPRRKVEYGTGLLVSKAGDILTDAELLTDCELIAVPGLGYAERIAADPAGLALLRVNGLRDAAPLALGGGTPSGEVALVGIADPQFQNGGKAVSTARGRLIAGGDGAAIDPAPSLGFAGAAALDRDGNLTGIVTLRPAAPPGVQAAAPGTVQVAAGGAPAAVALGPANGATQAAGGSRVQAILVPAQAIANFLTAQNVAIATGHAGIDAIKAATVRLICMRK
jgi:hypothetical protein